ncbi:MAG TPA: Rieske 2Fe-2S domain-containing protein [Planctomycetota bacterium]|jgi:nitrite reductase/ring-hydroxylating ferredoxin subunit|nr:Rieske 2Fe-2S domain-containing protein [Planctomycetota bacterium]
MAEFRKVACLSDLPPGTSRRVEVEGRGVALFNVSGQLYAIAERCPHRGGPLSEGTVSGGNIVCPWHGWTFDVVTGHRVGFPEGMGSISTYRVRIEGEDVLVEC